MAAHEFIASKGGLHRDVAAELGIEGNQRVGARWLFAGQGRGLTLERATELLREAGYISDDSHSSAIDVLERNAKGQPQYTAEGWQQMAKAKHQTRYEDHLAAQQEEHGQTARHSRAAG
jgi:hypothetical protein